MAQKFFDYLKERGFVYQSTNEVQVEKALNGAKPITFYLGIDPTADSLHIGHFFALRMFNLLQQQGHHGILIIGGATALVGDPTGKSDVRKMLSKETVAKNIAEVIALAKKFIKTDGENPARIFNNDDWISSFSYVDFMRLVGAYFNVNKMLASEAYSSRMENGGLTFLEMGYMPIQSYDFVHLNRTYDCTLEIGGSDQWGNIVAGTELSRKMNVHTEGNDTKDRPDTFGLTCPLLMTREGKKMGKTESGTLWVARDRTTPYTFYQYFYNTDDKDTAMLLKLFTDIPTAEIDKLCADDIIAAKKKMAFEITKLVHGADEAQKAVEGANTLFGKGGQSDNVPTATADKKSCAGTPVVDFVTAVGFFASKGEARRMIQQGGLSINGQKVSDINAKIETTDATDSLLLQKGKKNFLKVVLS